MYKDRYGDMDMYYIYSCSASCCTVNSTRCWSKRQVVYEYMVYIY